MILQSIREGEKDDKRKKENNELEETGC